MSRIADHGVHYECACGGRMLGVSPFEHLLADGVGARLWMVSEEGPLGARCPFCGRPMHEVPPGADGPAGIATCHTCEQVWVPPSVATWVGAHAAHPGPAGMGAAPEGSAGHPPRCEDCGAPWQPDRDGRCPFCHVQLSSPEAMVVTLAPARRPAERLLDAISDLIEG